MRAKEFDTNGTFITKFGSLGKRDGQFTDTEYLALDSDGNIYVSIKKPILSQSSSM
ncbi:MAG TPA: hypothetical protein VF222_02440 [Nitrososphaeraceae archaeon]